MEANKEESLRKEMKKMLEEFKSKEHLDSIKTKFDLRLFPNGFFSDWKDYAKD
jgi:hypothetical protein